MINGNPRDFIDTAYTGQDILFSYHGAEYWFQGFHRTDGTSHMEIMPYRPGSEVPFWEHDDTSMENCLNALQEEPIFDGKNFWQAEKEIEWLD